MTQSLIRLNSSRRNVQEGEEMPVQGGVALNYPRSLADDTGVQLCGLDDASERSLIRLLDEYGAVDGAGQLVASVARHIRCTVKCVRVSMTPSALHPQQASALHLQQTFAAEGFTTRILDLAVASEAVTTDGAEVLSEAAEQRAGAVLEEVEARAASSALVKAEAALAAEAAQQAVEAARILRQASLRGMRHLVKLWAQSQLWRMMEQWRVGMVEAPQMPSIYGV